MVHFLTVLGQLEPQFSIEQVTNWKSGWYMQHINTFITYYNDNPPEKFFQSVSNQHTAHQLSLYWEGELFSE